MMLKPPFRVIQYETNSYVLVELEVDAPVKTEGEMMDVFLPDSVLLNAISMWADEANGVIENLSINEEHLLEAWKEYCARMV